MAANFKRGDMVVLASAAVVPTGPVQDIKMDDEGGIVYLMGWVDADGNEQARWFKETELAAV